ncbi:MAG TPA: thiamine phosphate synthase, partial [Thermomicrobiales bacterium]|nr:thiamine phosphate synthase [Thermomicrobiales bacterium]
LLGLAATDHELSRWLVERGFVVDALEAEIHRLAGHQPNQPLPFDERVESKLPLPPGESRGEGDSAAAVHSTTTCPPSACGDPLPRGERTMLLRIIDAAANRAREAMRVLEDDARFALDDRKRTGEFKYMRHALAAELARFSAAELLAARDTPADVGTQLTAAAERRRGDLASVRTANFKRLQESLRSLEEFGKTFDAEFGAAMKQLRYRAYTLEQAAAVEATRFERAGPGAPPGLTGEGARPSLGRSLTGEGARPSLGRGLTGEGARRSLRLVRAKLYVLVDGRATLAEFDALVRTLIAAGVDVLQLRDKRLNDRQLLERARRLAELTAPTNTLSIVNDRADLAALAGADGVHVGQE